MLLSVRVPVGDDTVSAVCLRLLASTLQSLKLQAVHVWKYRSKFVYMLDAVVTGRSQINPFPVNS